MDWLKVLGLGVSGAGLVVTLISAVLKVGGMASDVKHLKDDVAATRSQVNSLYEHVAWGQRGEMGPKPPVDN